MLAPDLVVRGRRVVLPGRSGSAAAPRPATILVRAGRIVATGELDARVPEGVAVADAGDLVVLPGLVDTHVHVNEPGRAHWEGFASATRAAAAGGVTTLVDMPLNSIPATTSAAGLAAKIASARGKLHVDVGFCGGVVPGNAEELGPLRAAGVLGFKCFLAESGVEEFRRVGPDDLRVAMKRLADLDAPLLVHAELEDVLGENAKRMRPGDDPRSYATYLASRPKRAENEAVAFLVGLARDTGARAHVVHLSSAEALSVLWRAREEGLRLSAETCPHYLALAAEEIRDGATEFKCAPPIREAGNRELLWGALADGLVAQVVSDHSPCAPELKRLDTGDFLGAWGGIASLQLGLSVVWTEARRRGHGVEQIAEWMCAAPARLVGLSDRKGAIAPGLDADFVFFDPDSSRAVAPDTLLHRHKLTPYAGRVLHGVVASTWLRGMRVFERNEPNVARHAQAGDPRGTLLLAGRGPHEVP